jgi:hypothetical protein
MKTVRIRLQPQATPESGENIMPKFITDLHLGSFFSNAHDTDASSRIVLSSLAFPLSIVSGLLLLDGALSASVTSAAIGVLGLVAAQAIKTRTR